MRDRRFRIGVGGATWLALVGLCSPVAVAAAGGQSSPYLGFEKRPIKALSEERARGLAEGAGLGYAMAAELNGHAGPKHVLELAEPLGLTEAQRAGVEASFSRMKDEAVALGVEIVTAEEELDRRFAHRHLDETQLAELTARIAELEGRLRFVHLRAHLETDALLTAGQRERYVELRGYAENGSEGGAHEGHHVHGAGAAGGR